MHLDVVPREERHLEGSRLHVSSRGIS